MKTQKIILSMLLLGVVLVPFVAFAQPGDIDTMEILFEKIKAAVWSIFAIVVFVAFAVAGILFLTAGGAPDKIATARQMAIYGVIGIIVGILAYSILGIVTTLIAP